jgi:hypothetical protein
MIKDSAPAIELPLIYGEIVLRQAGFEQCTGRTAHPIGTLTLTGLRLFWLRNELRIGAGQTLRYIPLDDILSAKAERSLPHGFRYRLVVMARTHDSLRLVPSRSGADIHDWAAAITAQIEAVSE